MEILSFHLLIRLSRYVRLSFFLLGFFGIPSVIYGQIVADHSVVDRYDDIPQEYLDKVKKMLVEIDGESHSLGYRNGVDLLEILDNRFQVTTFAGAPLSYTDQYLRLGKLGEVGEETFYTSQTAINTYKARISNQNNTGNEYSVIGFAWCWDMHWINPPGGAKDPVHNVRWAGTSEGGPSGSLRWGLDSGDEALTGNSVCMDTYLNAVEQYIQHCTSNGYSTRMIFTTGPVDNVNSNMAGTENGFQRELKHDYIRNYVSANSSRILFDYADILCWNNSGQKYVTNWNDGGTIRPHTNIHPDNMMDYDASWNTISHTEDGDHIGEVGAVRLAKAMWWLLARIAGWDGIVTSQKKNELTPDFKVYVDGNSDEIRVTLPDFYISGRIRMYNLQGILISEKVIDGNLCVFRKSSLNNGVYIVKLNKLQFSDSIKFVIIN